jgi:DNA topoisomerase-1
MTSRPSNLVIVESHAKSKTISKYLNDIPELTKRGSFVVVACFGHIKDLPAKTLGVDKTTWTVEYETKGKPAVLANLKKLAKEALISGGKVYLASDMDLEGHAIAEHLRVYLKLQDRKQYDRVMFNEITKSALKEAFLHPIDIDRDAVDAQETRRILDRIVGYELSPLLWKTFGKYKLSAGRVQSAALNMIVHRADIIEKHSYDKHWKAQGTFTIGDTNNISSLDAHCRTKWTDCESALVNLKELTIVPSWEVRFTSSTSHKKPQAPFITSSLQQECFKRYGIPAKSTMMYAQALYEAGLITYMRTDSPALSQDAQASIISYVRSFYGEANVEPREYASKNTGAQEAHEAIRPSSVTVTVTDIGEMEGITPYHKKVYDIIWRRTVASQMAAAVYTDVETEFVPLSNLTKTQTYQFYGKTSILMKEGFLQVYSPEIKAQPGSLKAWETYLNAGRMKTQPISLEMSPDVTRPQPHFNEASFVKAMETEGIGRPSTYSAVVDKLYDKGYVVKGAKKELKLDAVSYTYTAKTDIKYQTVTITIPTEDKACMIPSDIGKEVVGYVAKVTPYLVDPSFTKLMESDLDKISSGKKTKKVVLEDFYQTFGPTVKAAGEVAKQPRTGTPSTTTSSVIKEYARVGACIKNTRYGPALYVHASKKFYSITSFIEWQEKAVEDITEEDAGFILSLPLKRDKYEVHLGRYGLYVKLGGKNIRMDKSLWPKCYDGTITSADIQTCINSPSQLSQPSPLKKRSVKKVTC